jgi:hypothetical protein
MSAYVVEQRLTMSGVAANRDWGSVAVFPALEPAELVAERSRDLWAVLGSETRVIDLETGEVVDRD